MTLRTFPADWTLDQVLAALDNTPRAVAEAAELAMELGLPVIRAHKTQPDGSCDCWAGARCEVPGKHPRTTREHYAGGTWSEWHAEPPVTSVYGLGDVGLMIKLPAGIWVYDVDRHPGGDDGEDAMAAFERRHGPLPGGLTVGTPRRGRHIYLQVPEGMRLVRVGPGVDIKGPRCLTMWAASRSLNGLYYILDDCLIPDAPGWAVEPAPPRRPATPKRPGGQGSARARLTGVLARVLEARKGERHNILHWACRRAAEMVEAGQLDRDAAITALETAGGRTGQPFSQVRATVASVLGVRGAR
jgi:hypothetical protein